MEQNEALKKVGLKITHPRVLVLEVLQQLSHQHVGAEDVYKALIENGAEIALATVYRVLNQFEEAGIVNRHHFETGKSVFELSNKNHHGHLVCIKCNKVIEFEDHSIEQCQQQLADKYNMKLSNHSLYLYGECKNGCKSA